MSILQMSLSGGAMILTVMLLRVLALHKLPKRFFVMLWVLVLVRLLVPFSLPMACSVYSLLSSPAPAATHVSSPLGVSQSPPVVWTGEVTELSVAADSVPFTASPWNVFWLIGLIVWGTYFAAAYCKCHQRFREALPVYHDYMEGWLLTHQLRRSISIRQSDQIAAPLTYGVLRPIILLPKSTDWDDLEALGYVLAHEWVHIRRFDGLLKLILTAALCMHWFNPLVWAMAFLANRDIELACDQAVLQLTGKNARAGYAMALIRMEEAKSDLLALGNHFSKNSLEERIQAMIKIKKTSLAALLGAVVLIGSATAFFATSAKAENSSGASYETTYDLVDKESLMSYTDREGTTYYSWDEGKTWMPMTAQEFAKAYPDPQVEWWTAEEYAAWLENEKKSLQDMIGSKGWTPSTGWFTWTQEMVTEAIAEYEEILALIQNGYLISKTVDGSEDTMLMVNPLDIVLGSAEVEEKEVLGDSLNSFSDHSDKVSLFADYQRCGLTFNDNDGSLYWNGQRVRIFVDGAEYGEGFASAYEHYDPEGTIDIHTVRERIDNGDGSYDLMGPLVRLEEFTPDQMFLDALECQQYVDAEIHREAEHTAKELERYTPFGLTSKIDPHTGTLTMDWNGSPVGSLFDRERRLYVANSLGGDGQNLEAVYEKGKLTGLRISKEKGYMESGTVIGAEAAVAEDDGNSSGKTIAEHMEQYAPYGLSYREVNGRKIIHYNGQTVESISDLRPDGSVFSVGSTDGGEVKLVTVYDSTGELSGLKLLP